MRTIKFPSIYRSIGISISDNPDRSLSSGNLALPFLDFEEPLAGQHVGSQIIIRGWLDEADLEVVECVEDGLVLAIGRDVAGIAEIVPEKRAVVELVSHRRFASRVRLLRHLTGQDRHQIREGVVADLVVTPQIDPTGLA